MSMTYGVLYDLMEAEAIEKKIPLSGGFEITARCNLNCVMCYVRKNVGDHYALENEMTADEIISLTRQARDMGMLNILLTGGEILVRKDFRYIYEEISKLGLIITLYTNGTLITEEWVDWIAKIPPLQVSITMYGASAETYKKVTGSGEAFHRVGRAVDMLLERGIKVELKTTWVKSSVDDYYELLEFAESKGLPLKIVNYIFPTKQNECSNPLGNRLDPETLAKKEIEVENYVHERWKDTETDPVSFDSDDLDKNVVDSTDGAYRCKAGVTSFWLSWRGEILPCAVSSEPKVQVENKNLSEAWNQLTKMTSMVPVCEDCSKCDARQYCMSCPARLHAENGSFTEPADYLCKHIRTRLKIIFN